MGISTIRESKKFGNREGPSLQLDTKKTPPEKYSGGVL
jgi:hypothetical protein